MPTFELSTQNNLHILRINGIDGARAEQKLRVRAASLLEYWDEET